VNLTIARVCVLAIAAAMASASRGAAVAGAVSMQYDVATPVSLHEPVVMIVTLTNESERPVRIEMGRDYVGAMHLALLRPDNRQLAAEPGQVTGVGGLFLQGQVTLAPGERRSFRWVLNTWFAIDQSGAYQLTVRGPARAYQEGTVLPVSGAMAEIRFTVDPRNPDRLKQRASSLLHAISSSPNWADTKQAAVELASIRDPIAVPYLSEAISLNKKVDVICIEGLERVGEPAADALREHAHNPDPGTSAAARGALKRLGKSG